MNFQIDEDKKLASACAFVTKNAAASRTNQAGKMHWKNVCDSLSSVEVLQLELLLSH
jgi:hypothetical protein